MHLADHAVTDVTMHVMVLVSNEPYLKHLSSPDYIQALAVRLSIHFTCFMMLFVICVRLLQPHTQGITRQ
jgi:hypothetical protein